jgi:hypothetical protein
MRTVLDDARRGHPGLYRFSIATAALVVVFAVLALVDQRSLLGVPVWLKPLKFAISFTAYAGVLAWMLGQLPGRAMRRTGWVLVTASTVELAIIAGQAGRGVRSHFNEDDDLGIVLYAVMGVTILVLYLATLAIAVRFLREPARDPAAGTAVRAGLGIGLVGRSVGFLMVAAGAHSVGVPDGGPGLALLGWSTVGGDLRVGHFVGMHALQAMPLLGALLATTERRRSPRRQQQVIRVAAAGYLAVVLLVTWQALRAQPVTRPDALTLAVAGVIVLATVAALARALGPDRSKPGQQHLATT